MESEEIIAEWCQEKFQESSENVSQNPYLSMAGLEVQSDVFDPGRIDVSFPPPDPKAPESLPAFMAVDWEVGAMGVDMRPHLFDASSKSWLLIDSGSQVTAVKPDPGDQVSPGLFLRAVNGSRIQCFGYKDIVVQLGRKAYQMRAIKADIQ